ncbi:MAG: hypothetical protein HY680_07565 [Chloroflexi bacterium]|nr:hypothetical protein [Chloroflexota bacterium]
MRFWDAYPHHRRSDSYGALATCAVPCDSNAGNAGGYSIADQYASCHPYSDGQPSAHQHANPYARQRPDAYQHSHADTHPYANPNADRQPSAYQHPYADASLDAHEYFYAYQHPNADSHAHQLTDRHANAHGYGHADAHQDTYTDSYARSALARAGGDTGLHSPQLHGGRRDHGDVGAEGPRSTHDHFRKQRRF